MLIEQSVFSLDVRLDALLNIAFIKAYMSPTLCHSDFYLHFGTKPSPFHFMPLSPLITKLVCQRAAISIFSVESLPTTSP